MLLRSLVILLVRGLVGVPGVGRSVRSHPRETRKAGDPAELVRRAERAIGQAIKAGQAAGTIRKGSGGQPKKNRSLKEQFFEPASPK